MESSYEKTFRASAGLPGGTYSDRDSVVAALGAARSAVDFIGWRAADAAETNRPVTAERVTMRLVAAEAALRRCAVVPDGLMTRDAFALLLNREVISTG